MLFYSPRVLAQARGIYMRLTTIEVISLENMVGEATVDLEPAIWTLSKWLAVKTETGRKSIVGCIDFHQPTLTDMRCQRLLNAHSQFYNLVAPVYEDANLRRLFYSFFEKQEMASFKRRLHREIDPDLSISVSNRGLPNGLLPRIGWLYATEFVDCGLNRLLSDSRPMSCRVDVSSDVGGTVWQAFRSQLDLLDLSERDEENLARAACSALIAYSGLFDSAFSSASANLATMPASGTPK